MISTSQVVENLVKQAPFLESALSQDIVNYSSLARIFRPKVEEKLLKDVKNGAIVMALKRISAKLKKTLPANNDLTKNLGDITIRSNLVDYTFSSSPTLAGVQKKLIEETSARKDIFVTISQGVGQVTVIGSEVLENEIKKLFSGEKLISKFGDLSSLTINLAPQTTETPGVYYAILKMLAWEGINVIEVVSTFTELTIILENKDISRAFSLLKKN